MANRIVNRADRIVRTRMRAPLGFQSLTENRAIRLSSVTEYTGRSHFMPWHRILAGLHDFANMAGIFTPLVFVEIETTDAPCDPVAKIEVRGESFLGRSLDSSGATRNLAREGNHTVIDDHGTLLARARMLNVFTRYDPDPARRRVTELTVELGLGQPRRVIEVPRVEGLLDTTRKADFEDDREHAWHYGQTDPNRHVNGIEYLRVMEEFVADALHAAGHDLKRLFAGRARIVYRKPCFRGEGYRRRAWFRSEAPLVLVGAIFKAGDDQPAAAVELTMLQHHDIAGQSVTFMEN
jgi:acyl-CoA thioesterase FadM